MKYILIAALVFVGFGAWAQGPPGPSGSSGVARWVKARDYLSCKLALEAIREKVKTDSSIRSRFLRIEPALAAVTLAAPLSTAALDGELREFGRVRLVVVDPLARVDVRAFASSPDGVRRLVDTAFAIAGRGYVFDERVRAAVRGEVGKFLADTTPRVAAAPGGSGSGSGSSGIHSGGTGSGGSGGSSSKPVIAMGGQPVGGSSGNAGAAGSAGSAGAASHGGRGFDFWVLLPLILLAVLCVILWRKYQEIKEELRARKVEMRSFNENYFSSVSGARGGGSGGSGAASGGSRGADRKEVERLVGDSATISELNKAIERLQVRVAQLEGKGAPPSPVVKARPKPVEPEPQKVRSADGAEVFYMAGPVNNYFPNSAKSPTKDNTVYRFKVSPNRQDAEFELHTSGAPINEIVQLAESYIKAACDEENVPSYPVKNIVTKRAGVAILDGDKWVIKSKALIRYE